MKVNELISAISEAESNLSEARSALSDHLRDIIKELGEELWGTIISTYMYKDYLEVTTEWSARNCTNHSDYRIPKSVIESDDPVEAAKKWKLNEERKKEAQDRARMEAEFQRLKTQLNK